jgi:asparagine synthase (glutamine-hydrolysing)
MCGIAGLLSINGTALPSEKTQVLLREMARRLHHRGPDGYGLWADRRVGLAHTRLAVIDTSNAGTQPMHDVFGRYHIVFNGEIYNFLELRRQLEMRGHVFRSHSDTEVLLYGYSEWGTGLFSRLDGMFALALWDSSARRLVLARDRFGEKPFYYSLTSRHFVFASEIKAILAAPAVKREPNLAAVHDYLTYGYTQGPGTAFENIQRLPPAHFMVVDEGNPPVQTRYWELPSLAEQVSRSQEELCEGLIEHLRNAVNSCLIADVPLGAFLSGGVDSSAVVAMMRSSRKGPIKTFSSGFDYENYDETHYASMVAKQYQTTHHVYNFGTSVLASLNKLAWHYGEPYSDSSALVTFALAEQVRKSVTVALTGDGADELLLGYQRYFRFRELMEQKPASRVRTLHGLYNQSTEANNGDERVAVDSYGFLVERMREQQKLSAYGTRMLTKLAHCSYDNLRPYLTRGADPVEMAGRFDVGTYLCDNMLVKVDVATMASSLESRSPFLNHKLAEYVARIPANQRVWGSEGKALLKKALEPWLPREVMYRTKMGFRVPVAAFMRTVASKQTAEFLESDRFADRGLFRPAYVKQLMNEHVSSRYDHGTRLWSLICLEMWFRTYIDNDGAQILSEDENPFASFAEGVGNTQKLSALKDRQAVSPESVELQVV